MFSLDVISWTFHWTLAAFPGDWLYFFLGIATSLSFHSTMSSPLLISVSRREQCGNRNVEYINPFGKNGNTPVACWRVADKMMKCSAHIQGKEIPALSRSLQKMNSCGLAVMAMAACHSPHPTPPCWARQPVIIAIITICFTLLTERWATWSLSLCRKRPFPPSHVDKYLLTLQTSSCSSSGGK